jgi:hypothetical protein
MADKALSDAGIRVVHYEGEGRGFRNSQHPGVLFVNRKQGGASYQEALGHELVHDIEANHPDLWEKMKAAVPPKLFEAKKAWYQEAFSKQGRTISPDNLEREGYTTALGEILGGSSEAGDVLMNRDPGFIGKIINAAQRLFAKFTGKAPLLDTAIEGVRSALDRQRAGLANRRVAPRSEAETPDFLPTGNDEVREHADAYAKGAGLSAIPDRSYVQVNEQRATKIAGLYDAMKHTPDDPAVKASYDALKKETLNQYEFLKSKGVKFEPWNKEGQPYKDSAEMMADVAKNKHLYFFQGGEMPADHPLAENVPGSDLTYNEVFRAVHDYFGHAKEGYGFGPRGEENAWRQHSQMYSEAARPAMTTETRGQNSFVNYGPNGPHNRANPGSTIYADQKAGLLPSEFHRVDTGEGTDFLPNPAKSFWDEDVKPRIKAVGEAVASAWTGLKSLAAPQTRSANAALAAGVWRKRNADFAQRVDRVSAEFDKAKKIMDSAPVAVTRKMIDEIETGQPQTTPGLQPLADALRDIFDERLSQVQMLGTGKLTDFIQNYFPHLWNDPKAAAKVFGEAAAAAPLQGKKGFLKQRSIPTLAEGIARGLEPLTENPVEAMMLRVREMDKYITAHEAMQEMDSKGLLKTIKAKDKVPDGYAKINDSIATIYAKPSRRGAIQTSGFRVAPEEVANLVNNQTSPGLRNNKYFGGAFRALLGAGNLMNGVQLGLSAFHLAMTTLDSATSKMALAFEKVGEGDIKGAAKEALLGATVIGPAVQNISRGNKVMKEWYHPGTTDHQTQQIVYWMKEAGGRALQDPMYHIGMVDKMMEAFRKGNFLGGVLRAPFAAIDASVKPVMEMLVPRMKMGSFMDLAKFELARMDPAASHDEIRAAMGRAWDSVDNRMGQLVYDNLFWNKAVKDLAMASTRSVGWNLGTFRELGGGAVDLVKQTGRLVRGKGFDLTHRMAYTAAMPIVAGILGGTLQYIMTGDKPKETKDWFFPRTGQKDETGHDVRLALPSYMKDVYAYSRDPLHTLKDKTHPLISSLFQMMENKDYYGTEIRNEDDPIYKQLWQASKFAGKQFVPFAVRELGKSIENKSDTKTKVLPFFGITQARRDITLTPAELHARELLHERRPQGLRTQEQAERADLVGQLTRSLRLKEPDAVENARTALAEGRITAADVENIKTRLQHPGLEANIRSLDLHDAMSVWEKASAEERRKIGPTMFAKLRASKSLTREQKVGYMQVLQKDWKELKAGD